MAHEKTSLVHWIVLLACEQARDHHKANQVATGQQIESAKHVPAT
jgi:hypothetical protein